MRITGAVDPMTIRNTAALLGLAVLVSPIFAAGEPTPVRPKSGKVEILPLSEVKPGMKATAWTVLQGTEPEPIPIEIIGRLKNVWGPNQDIIVAKMTGKAQRTNVAGGMSGSPVYINGKLIGAVALRLSVFSPDAICGITPIELMLEINDFDKSRPAEAKAPGNAQRRAALELPPGLLAQAVNAGASADAAMGSPLMVPIDTPLTLSGFTQSTIQEFGPMMRQMGLNPVQGGATGAL